MKYDAVIFAAARIVSTLDESAITSKRCWCSVSHQLAPWFVQKKSTFEVFSLILDQPFA